MNIGFIGLGIMGQPMCKNLMEKNLNDSFFVYDVDAEKAKDFVARGATLCESIAEVGKNADIVFSMVPKSSHVMMVYKELLSVARKDQILVDMSSIEPSVSKKLAEQTAETGAVMLDCPVVKSREAAEKGMLGIYCGGEQSAYEKVKPYLLCMGENTIHLGKNGTGTAMKAIHNMLVGQIQNGVNEMLLLAQKKDITIDDFCKAISYGGAGNFYLTTKANAIKNKDYTTAFSVENMHKDVHIAQDLASEDNITLAGINTVVSVYDDAIKEGLGGLDFSASYEIVKGKTEK